MSDTTYYAVVEPSLYQLVIDEDRPGLFKISCFNCGPIHEDVDKVNLLSLLNKVNHHWKEKHFG